MKRRGFLALGGVALPAAAEAAQAAPGGVTTEVSLNGEWQFRTSPPAKQGWRTVMVPHTWQVEPGTEEHYGPAWYAREFEAPEAWRGSHVRIEFESVFHTAAVRVNGTPVGEHRGAGYTAFTVDITSALRFGARNRV
ncbi:MAG: hypothetical protein MUC42_16755, partial [Bryobacter sp.]|nr:hypothetical protein [Bryobacter sp.]